MLINENVNQCGHSAKRGIFPRCNYVYDKKKFVWSYHLASRSKIDLISNIISSWNDSTFRKICTLFHCYSYKKQKLNFKIITPFYLWEFYSNANEYVGEPEDIALADRSATLFMCTWRIATTSSESEYFQHIAGGIKILVIVWK